MNQPPPSSKPPRSRPDWLRPAGVAEGTWAYTQQRSIADHYGDFVAGTPLCSLDQQFIRQHFDQQISRNEKPRLHRIIDFGCGNGRSLIPLAIQGHETIGVDLSQAMLAVARQNAADSNVVGSTRWIRANLVELDCLSDDSVDHAICLFSTLGMIQGRSNRREFLRHARRIVRPEGTFVLHVHSVWSAISEPGGWKRLASSLHQSVCSRQHDFGDHVYAYRGLANMYLHRFRWSELSQDLKTSGWQIEQRHRITAEGNQFAKANRFRPDQIGGYIVVAN